MTYIIYGTIFFATAFDSHAIIKDKSIDSCFRHKTSVLLQIGRIGNRYFFLFVSRKAKIKPAILFPYR